MHVTFFEKLKSSFIYHSFHLITGPLKLIVTVKGEANDTLSSLAGIYILGPVNDKSHWLQDPGKHAIWLIKELGFWAIGLQDDLGKTNFIIASPEDVVGPQEVTSWKNLDFENVDNILVDIEPGELPDLSIYEYFPEYSILYSLK